jgi:hypothetical protein
MDVLGCAAGKSNQEAAAEVEGQFPESRLDGLANEPRLSAPRKTATEQIEDLSVLRLTLRQWPVTRIRIG